MGGRGQSTTIIDQSCPFLKSERRPGTHGVSLNALLETLTCWLTLGEFDFPRFACATCCQALLVVSAKHESLAQEFSACSAP